MSGLNDVVKQAQQQIDAIEHALGIPQQTPGEGSPPGQANTAPIGAQGGEGGDATAAPQSSQQGQQGQPQQQQQGHQQPPPFQAQQDQTLGQQAQQQIPSEDRKWESMYRTAEQKFQVLQGKYNAEVPRLQHQLRDTEQRASTFEAKASTLEQRVMQLEQAMQAGQGGAGQAGQGQQGQFNQQGQQGQQGKAGQAIQQGANGGFPIDLSRIDFKTLAETYPDDLAPIIQTIPQMVQHMQSQESVIATLQQQLAATTEGMRKVVTNVEQVNAERAGNAQRAFHAELGRMCPEWQQIDNMPDFHNWLDQRKPMSVRTYRQDAEEAFRVGDAVAVAECYNAFKSDFLNNQQMQQQPHHQQQQPPNGSQQQGQGQGQQGSGQQGSGQQGSGQQQQNMQQSGQQQPVQGQQVQQGNPQPQQTFMQFDEFGQPIYIGPRINQQGQQGQQSQQQFQQGQQQFVQGQPYNPLEYMVEPSPSAGNPPQAPPQKRIYTIQEITDHNTKMTKNPRLLQDPVWAATEKDMANAVLEGRVAGQLPDMRLQSGEARFVQGI